MELTDHFKLLLLSSSSSSSLSLFYHHSGFMIVAFSVLCVRLAVEVFFMVNILNAFLILFINIFSHLVTIPVALMTKTATKDFIFHIR
jgi:hypothetical protein